ncbi:hypothetical protein J6590_030072 [Homalodisca vitripennis]|nr:hypothetical protein J6590_030072 [Homalodisca vitripennis]
MATISQNSNFNWMSLAKIFLNGVKQKQPAPKKMRSTTSRQKSQSFRKMSRKINTNNVSNCDLHEEQMAVISRFETLRKQLLHQLLVYQKELLACNITERFQTRRYVGAGVSASTTCPTTVAPISSRGTTVAYECVKPAVSCYSYSDFTP